MRCWKWSGEKFEGSRAHLWVVVCNQLDDRRSRFVCEVVCDSLTNFERDHSDIDAALRISRKRVPFGKGSAQFRAGDFTLGYECVVELGGDLVCRSGSDYGDNSIG